MVDCTDDRLLRLTVNVKCTAMILLCTFACMACSSPIHFTQSPHALVYSQRYTLCPDQRELRERLITEVFGAPPIFSPPAEKIEQLLVRGQINYVVRAAPGMDSSAFIIEGGGRHLVFYGKTDAQDTHRYMGSADFRLNDDGPLSLSDLQRGALVVRASVISKASFTNPLHAFQAETQIFLRIFIKEIAANVYTIDHAREHDIGWRVASNGPRQFIQVIGHMQFIGPNDGRDLFDAREIRFIASDYGALLANKLDVPRQSMNVPFIEWLREQPCNDRYMDLLL